jgi:hypothetical protein
MDSCVRRNDRVDLYEIPITCPLLSPRKPMRSMALQPGKARSPIGARVTTHRNIPMLDILMLALAFGFFAAGIGYAYACERL